MTNTSSENLAARSGGEKPAGSPALVWFREDLRIGDNPALDAAVKSGRPVVAVYIFDPVSQGVRPIGAAQKWMLHQALTALAGKLEGLGSRLVLRAGPAGDVLPLIAGQTGAAAVYWNRRHVAAEVAIDTALKQQLTAAGIEVKSFNGNLLHEPALVKTGDGGPYRVYSPFWRALEKLEPPRRPLPAPTALTPYAGAIESMALDNLALLPTRPDWAGGLRDSWQGGEDGGLTMLANFTAGGLRGYADGRDFPGKAGVSRLSPYLRFGMVSPYQAWHGAGDSDASPRDVEKFRKELGWREFAWHLLFHYPDLATRNFDARFDNFPWRGSPQALAAWQRGRTGYPIVDAGMRELWHTGYMHNRVRMVVASFLIKHLMIDWREGEAWFWDTLVDGDPANNSASWQWVAGCGADAAPYFRIFNPVIQGEKFDGNGEYVRRWVPEIAKLPDRFLHKPWEAPKEVLAKAGIVLGGTYPMPIVDHPTARDSALEAFESLKKAS